MAIRNPLTFPTGIAALVWVLGCAIALSACSTGQGTPATARENDNAEAVTGEQLLVIPPGNWTLAAASNSGKFRRAQYLRDPEAEMLETLTLEYLDPDGLPDPIKFLESMAVEQSERCEGFSSRLIGSGMENGYPSAVRLMNCPYRKVNRSATISLAKAIQGNEGYYLLVFEKRASASRDAQGWKSEHVSEEEMATWALYLKRALACDTRSAEHPCEGARATPAPADQVPAP